MARLEPLRSLLPPCPRCQGGIIPGDCPDCRYYDKGSDTWISVGRRLSRITTSSGAGGPDLLICGNGPAGPILVAIEVKSFRDLLDSAGNGRLQAEGEGQLPAMLKDYDQNWLVWYGPVRRGESGYLEEPVGRGDGGQCRWGIFSRNGGRPRNGDANGPGQVRGLTNDYLDGLELAVAAMGVHVVQVQSDRQAARWLAALYRYWTKPYEEHRFTRTFSAAPRFPQVIAGVTATERDRAQRVFDRYPGLGMERALAAAKHFPSVRAMANAGEREWQEVPGIGKVIAAAVVRGFNS